MAEAVKTPRKQNRNPDRLIRSINIDPKIWALAQAKAKEEDTNMSKIIRNSLEAYVNGVA